MRSLEYCCLQALQIGSGRWHCLVLTVSVFLLCFFFIENMCELLFVCFWLLTVHCCILFHVYVRIYLPRYLLTTSDGLAFVSVSRTMNTHSLVLELFESIAKRRVEIKINVDHKNKKNGIMPSKEDPTISLCFQLTTAPERSANSNTRASTHSRVSPELKWDSARVTPGFQLCENGVSSVNRERGRLPIGHRRIRH